MSEEQNVDSQTNTEESDLAKEFYPDAAVDETKVEDAPEGTPDGEADKSIDKVEVESEFDLKLPEETLLDESVLDEIASIAKEQGLSKEQAQVILDMQSKSLSSFQEKTLSQFNEQVKAWGEEIASDKEFGGDRLQESVNLAKNAVKAYAGEDLLKELDESGYGNHPKLFKMLVKIGKEMEAGSLVHSNAQESRPKSMADLFYGTKTNF